jgi:hypothetical protein
VAKEGGLRSMQVAISSIKIPTTTRIRINPGNLMELAENIKRYGMLHPIVVNEQMELIAGYRRLKAAESIGWTEVPVSVIAVKSDNPLLELAISLTEFDQQVSENVHRLNLAPLELSDAILERKHRFEQIYGPIKHGGDRTNNNPEESKLQTLQLAPPDFYEETARLFRMSTSAIYQLLRLQGLDIDLKQKVATRELNYAAALSEQAERNQANKKNLKSRPKSPLRIAGLPDPKTAELFTAMFKQTPKLFQIFQLVNHSWQTMQRLHEYQAELTHLDLELLHNFIVQLGEVLALYNSLFTNLQKTQDLKLNLMLDANNTK